jgi:ferredoxin
MPTITVDGKTFEVEAGTRLVLAIEENGIRIGHRCGGKAKCTTCRVVFEEGEPSTMTAAEYNRLNQREIFGQFRLSCQVTTDHDMKLRTLMRADNQPDWNDDTGPTPEETVEPEAVWYPINMIKESMDE